MPAHESITTLFTILRRPRVLAGPPWWQSHRTALISAWHDLWRQESLRFVSEPVSAAWVSWPCVEKERQVSSLSSTNQIHRDANWFDRQTDPVEDCIRGDALWDSWKGSYDQARLRLSNQL